MNVALNTADGVCNVAVFRPEGQGPWPGVIVFMDGVGIRPALFELAERIAAHSYFVLLPDLFYRAGPYETPSFAMFSDPEKRGGLSLDAAGNVPDRVAASASYHGARLATDNPDSPHLLAPRMKARVYVAGAVEDSSFPDDMKKRLDDALTAAGVEHVVETYEGARHGWVMPDAPVYNPAAAERHWKTLFALFDATLE